MRAELPLTICGADTDGDYFEEGIAVVFNPSEPAMLYIQVFNNEDSVWIQTEYPTPFAFSIPLRAGTDYYHYIMSMESGDLDGDETDELVCFLGNNLIVYEFVNGAFGVLYSGTFFAGALTEYTLRGCVGDLNVNVLDNIIVTHGLDHTADAEYL